MITRLRAIISKRIEGIAAALAKTGVSPNAVTLLGLAISFVCIVGAYVKTPVVVFIALLASSLMDVLDGAIARVSGRVSVFGSVLDSFSDRVEEFAYLVSLKILGASSLLVVAALATSFLISYLRALGEKHRIAVEGIGILERGERITLMAVAIVCFWFGYAQASDAALMVLVALGCLTIIQRLLCIYRGAKKLS